MRKGRVDLTGSFFGFTPGSGELKQAGRAIRMRGMINSVDLFRKLNLSIKSQAEKIKGKQEIHLFALCVYKVYTFKETA